MQPPLQAQFAAAATAAAQRPTLLAKLQEAAVALDNQLLATAAAAATAAATAHNVDASADPDDPAYEKVEKAAAAEASRGCYKLQLSQHWLVADAVGADAGAAWLAYQSLLAQMQLINEWYEPLLHSCMVCYCRQSAVVQQGRLEDNSHILGMCNLPATKLDHHTSNAVSLLTRYSLTKDCPSCNIGIKVCCCCLMLLLLLAVGPRGPPHLGVKRQQQCQQRTRSRRKCCRSP